MNRPPNPNGCNTKDIYFCLPRQAEASVAAEAGDWGRAVCFMQSLRDPGCHGLCYVRLRGSEVALGIDTQPAARRKISDGRDFQARPKSQDITST